MLKCSLLDRRAKHRVTTLLISILFCILPSPLFFLTGHSSHSSFLQGWRLTHFTHLWPRSGCTFVHLHFQINNPLYLPPS